MRVLEEAYKGVSEGMTVPLAELGLPAPAAGGLLLVFWKER